MKKIDYKSGFIFAAAAIPGSVLGALSVAYINRSLFNIIFGVLLAGASIYLFFKPQKIFNRSTEIKADHNLRTIIDSDNVEHVYSFNGKLGVIISAGVGYLSSLLGIGGGIIHVPVMVNVLNFPVHIATATSHFILALIALTGTVTHIFQGSFTADSLIKTLFLAIGVVAGAQLGARLSKKVHGKWIIKSLAAALFFVGIRILLMAY